MKKPPPPTLRDRIIDQMAAILELMAAERSADWSDEDFRPAVVRRIKRIADLKATTKSQARRVFDRVAKDIKRLELSIADLPPSAREHIKVAIDGLDQARGSIEQESGRVEVKRKRTAAGAAYDMIAIWGSAASSLSADSAYIELAALLYFVATGRRASLRKSCAKHFDNIKEKAGVDLRSSDRGPRGSRDTGDGPPGLDLERHEKEMAVEMRRRKAVVASWPPLEDVVDQELGSKL